MKRVILLPVTSFVLILTLFLSIDSSSILLGGNRAEGSGILNSTLLNSTSLSNFLAKGNDDAGNISDIGAMNGNMTTSLPTTTNANNQEPWLGVNGLDITPAMAQILGLEEPVGFLVINVTAGSFADKAGIVESRNITNVNGTQLPLGGDIILKIDNKSVSTHNDIQNYLEKEKKVGDNIQLTVLRGTKSVNINDTLVPKPELSVYDNKEFGLEFRYPSEWLKDAESITSNNTLEVRFLTHERRNPTDIESLTVRVEPLSSNKGLNDYVNASKAAAEDNPFISSIESFNSTFLGSPAHITHAVLNFYGTLEGLSLTGIAGDDKLVDISYITNSETFQKNLKMIDKLIASFKEKANTS